MHEDGPLQRLVEQAGPQCIGQFSNIERKTAGGLHAKRMRFLRLGMTKTPAAPLSPPWRIPTARCLAQTRLPSPRTLKCGWTSTGQATTPLCTHNCVGLPYPSLTISPHCLTVASAVHRHLFAQQVAHGDLKVNLGRLQIAENNPRPEFSAVAPGDLFVV